MTKREIPPELDQITETVLSYDPRKAKPKEEGKPNRVKTWSTSIAEILGNGDLRLDASHFDPVASAAIDTLEKSGYKLERLGDIADVYLRGQFTRIWAEDKAFGIPYLNATDLLTLLSLGAPSSGMRYLSSTTDTDVNALKIESDWLLMTCSGTIGRVFYVPNRLNGWVATHDLIRIVAPLSLVGYLYSYLTNPLAQAQILSHTHGGQIDHVTDEQVKGVLVPRLDEEDEKRINTQTVKALRARERAMDSLMTVWDVDL